jgi:hypothetical protein
MVDMENSLRGDEGGPFQYFGISSWTIEPAEYHDLEKMNTCPIFSKAHQITLALSLYPIYSGGRRKRKWQNF